MSQNLKNNSWLLGKIVSGKGLARTMGYPTINLDNPNILAGQKEGVYLTQIKIQKLEYNGLLYYGPRLVLGETNTILEIFVMGFNGSVYGDWIDFRILKFIRGVMDFKSLDDLKKQIELDFDQAIKFISQTS